MIDAVNDRDLQILIPVGIGAVGGLIAFSHILSWVFKRFRDQTISLLTGFIFGSVSILWPWQRMIYMTDAAGELVMKKGEPIVMRYERYLPDAFNNEVLFALAIAVAGIVSIWAIEKAAEMKSN
jgi:putative membrane protein